MKKIFLLITAILLFAQNFDYTNPFENETNTSLYESNASNITQEIILEANYISLKPKINIALIIDKKKFFKFIPSIINSVNAYFLNKNAEYEIKVFDIDANITNIKKEGFNNILVYSIDKEYIKNLCEYNNTNFYIPVYNKQDLDVKNLYFGGVNYKQQIGKFVEYMDTNYAVAINDNTILSKKLFHIENEFNLTLSCYEFPEISYNELNEKYVFLNIAAGKSAQVLSNITAKDITTKLIFASQIDYNPLLLEITQPQDVEKLLIANSILYVPKEIEDTNLNLNSDIKYNWLNYATSVLLNKIYNKITKNDEFYMNDFNLYIFNRQIEYKTKLFQIINGAFKTIE